ncbi:unnamed protein product [Linum tenue]|uniref:Uncharacterized protein n=1 Tax=Linum tenue TaxID=586396 RepID=A0AAV0RA41_9ROSI|nr:unnamed protein product [Linum tenue]
MVLFDFKSDKHFVASSDRTTLQVYDRNTHWEEVATITARDRDQIDDDDQDEGDDDDDETYDGLMFFDGHGKIEGREALTKLAQHLTRLQLRVSPQGFCFQDVTTLGEHKAFGFHYLRLNDLFNWSYHGIRTPSMATWRRLVLEYTVPKREKRTTPGEKRPTPTADGVSKEMYEELKKTIGKKDEELEKLREEVEKKVDQKKRPMSGGAAVSKKKYEELKRMIEGRDEKIGKMREEMEEQHWEMEKLKEERGKHGVELRELEKKNGKELRKLSKQKDGELETLKREKDGELEEKDEELEALRKEKDDAAKLSKVKDEELKKLREEVKNMKRANKKEDEAAVGEKGKITIDSDEWQKLKKDAAEMRQEVMKKDEEMKRRLEKVGNDNEALQKLANEKTAESQKLRSEKEEMMKENADEMRKLKDQLLQVPREPEQRPKQSWVKTTTTKLVSLSFCNDDIISRRRPVPRDTFCIDERKSSNFNYKPYQKGSVPFLFYSWTSVVDEDSKDWPPPPKMNVYSSSGSFDQDNWWLMKTTHLSDGSLTMMAYYDGNFRCSVFSEYTHPIRLPYSWDNRLMAGTSFFLVHVGREYKLAFMYRD